MESKVKRNIDILSKLRYFVSLNTLRNLYYALIYSFLTYASIVWGCTYSSTLQSLFILQKRSIRIITFTKYYEHTSMLFKSLNIMKLIYLITFHVAVFMKKFYNKLLPFVFDDSYLRMMYMTIILGLQVRSLVFQKLGPIMVFLISDFMELHGMEFNCC